MSLANHPNVLGVKGMMPLAQGSYFSDLPGRSRLAPTQLPGLAAWYDLRDAGSYITATGVKLLGDKSGNSGVKVLCLNGVVGNYASTPDAVPLQITGDIDLRCKVNLPLITPAANTFLVVKDDQAALRAYSFFVGSTGALQGEFSLTGTTVVASISSVTLASLSLLNATDYWFRVTRVSATGAVNFYYSADGIAWNAVGTQQSTTSGAMFNSAQPVHIGRAGINYSLGNYYRAQILNGIAGTLVFDADFSKVAKLATTFTESSVNAATVTINTTGDLGARICGARDLVNLTGANQPTLSGGGALFNGSSQYLKCAGFSLGQPATVYFCGQQKTWVSTRVLFDGGAITTGQAIQTTSTPQLNISAGSSVAANTGLAVTTNGVFTAIFNGASSFDRVNKIAAVSGSAGAGTMNGFTLGATASATLWANIIALEVLIFSYAHDQATQNRVITYLGNKWGIPVGS